MDDLELYCDPVLESIKCGNLLSLKLLLPIKLNIKTTTTSSPSSSQLKVDKLKLWTKGIGNNSDVDPGKQEFTMIEPIALKLACKSYRRNEMVSWLLNNHFKNDFQKLSSISEFNDKPSIKDAMLLDYNLFSLLERNDYIDHSYSVHYMFNDHQNIASWFSPVEIMNKGHDIRPYLRILSKEEGLFSILEDNSRFFQFERASRIKS
eukprot:gene6686-8271_t